MGLRCLMGHDFGEVLTERDRNERGDEVVVTVREYRECDRCGQTRVVSENKEVRRTTGAEPTASDGEPADSAAAPAADDASGGFEDVSAEEDDGVILPNESEGRQRGAWPETDDDDEEPAGEEPAPWPEVEGDDEGFDAEPSDGAPLEGVQFGSGLTPEASSADSSGDAGGDVIESSADGERDRPRRSSPSRRRSSGGRAVAAETELVCPECEHTAPTENSSLRPGDICPSCRLGYLTERER